MYTLNKNGVLNRAWRNALFISLVVVAALMGVAVVFLISLVVGLVVSALGVGFLVYIIHQRTRRCFSHLRMVRSIVTAERGEDEKRRWWVLRTPRTHRNK